MAEINLSNSKGRDAVVTAESVTIPLQVRWVDKGGAQAASHKILRATVPHDLDALLQNVEELDDVADLLVQGDPEIDMESYGEFLEDSSRVYVDPKKEIVHKVTLHEVVRTPEGEVKEERPKKSEEPNVATEIPLKWTGKKFKKSQVYRRFVFTGKMQIVHINGLTYDFLYEMAKQLEDEESLMLIAGGAKGTQPLLFRRGGLEYRGFLEGRTDGRKYALILHLTNMELKKPNLETPPPSKDSPKQTTDTKTMAKKATKKKTAAKKAVKKKAAKSAPKKKAAAKKAVTKKSAKKKVAKKAVKKKAGKKKK